MPMSRTEWSSFDTSKDKQEKKGNNVNLYNVKFLE